MEGVQNHNKCGHLINVAPEEGWNGGGGVGRDDGGDRIHLGEGAVE